MSIREWLAPSGRTEQAGMFLAGAAVPYTFQRTLMPRGVLDQALATGIVMALEYAVGVLVQDSIEGSAAWMANALEHEDEITHTTWRRYAMALDLSTVALGVAVRKIYRQREGENVGRSWARLIGTLVSNGAFAGLSVGVFQEVSHDLHRHGLRGFPLALPGGVLLTGILDTRRRRAERAEGSILPSRLQGWEAFAASPLIALGLVGVSAGERAFARSVSRSLSRLTGGHERLWRPVGHVAAITGIVLGVGSLLKLVYGRIEDIATHVEPAFDTPPGSTLVSGGPGSLVPWETLSKQGRRYVSTYLPAYWIERVMGEDAEAEPIRVFAAFDCAGTDEERVALTMRELERTRAFDRPLLMVISPTGTGYVNYVAVEAAEYLTLGNMASVALQYSKRPSVLSMDRVPDGVRQYRLFIEALHSRLSELPPGQRPRVVLFGESLGAWTSEDAFEGRGTDGMLELGVDRGLWIGTPHATKWKEQVLGAPREDVDRSLVAAFNDFEQVEALSPEQREALRYVMITHYNDAVAQFGLDLLVREPRWLGDPEQRPSSVPATEVYAPLVTFVLTLIDMKNSANVIPGQFEAKGHDYRKDLARFVREVYSLPCDNARLAGIERALREAELTRQDRIDTLDRKEKKDKALQKSGERKQRGKRGTTGGAAGAAKGGTGREGETES
ncbi:MAG: alpha/beta hydrolase [Actinobacteria bacterium]|nr:alpha/beta hydrolase [Actinomycetota bacterium]MBU2687141.1 alpha/beta hydrolase [Actinomycetota bacterium]